MQERESESIVELPAYFYFECTIHMDPTVACVYTQTRDCTILRAKIECACVSVLTNVQCSLSWGLMVSLWQLWTLSTPIIYPAILQFCLGLEIKEHMLCIRSSMILQSDNCMMLVIILCMIYRKNINIVTSSTFNVIKTLLYGLKIVKLAWWFWKFEIVYIILTNVLPLNGNLRHDEFQKRKKENVFLGKIHFMKWKNKTISTNFLGQINFFGFSCLVLSTLYQVENRFMLLLLLYDRRALHDKLENGSKGHFWGKIKCSHIAKWLDCKQVTNDMNCLAKKMERYSLIQLLYGGPPIAQLLFLRSCKKWMKIIDRRKYTSKHL